MPECQKIKNGGLDQYDDERFDRLIFATIRKYVELKGLRSNSKLMVESQVCLVLALGPMSLLRIENYQLGAMLNSTKYDLTQLYCRLPRPGP